MFTFTKSNNKYNWIKTFIPQNLCKRYYHIFKTKILFKPTYILGQAAIQKFLLNKTVNHVFQVGNWRKIWLQKAVIDFYIIRTFKYQNYS